MLWEAPSWHKTVLYVGLAGTWLSCWTLPRLTPLSPANASFSISDWLVAAEFILFRHWDWDLCLSALILTGEEILTYLTVFSGANAVPWTFSRNGLSCWLAVFIELAKVSYQFQSVLRSILGHELEIYLASSASSLPISIFSLFAELCRE